MKQDHPRIGMGRLCRLFGKTRHAYYDALWRKENSLVKEDVILQEVMNVRKDLPLLGGRKLHHVLQPRLASHEISIGRDYLFDLLAEHSLLIRRRKRKVITTDSRHWMRKYSNLIKTISANRPEQIWVSDITYIRMNSQWGYLSLITDAYSRMIMGYNFRNDLEAEGCIEALKMAVNNRKYNDQLINKSINAYNQLRPHASCDYMTPEQTHLKSGQLVKRWKNYNNQYNHEKATV